ncbi:MAG: hypothetical protein WAL52_08260 [Candidatus Sulfotelmatobacter sp.]
MFRHLTLVIGALAILIVISSTCTQAQETPAQHPADTQKTDPPQADSTQADSTQAAPPEVAPPPREEKSIEIPPEGKWKFNFDAGWGSFGFANSLYTDVAPDPSENLGNNWFEGYIKPAISGSTPLGGGELYGKLSAVGERTYGGPSIAGENASSFMQEDVYGGWRSGSSLSSSKNLLDFTFGRAPYVIGHGLLVSDGTGEGGSRGGYWTNARKAWKLAGIARIKPGNHTIEGFYLDRDDVPENRTGTRLAGVNYQYAAGKNSTLGATWLRAFAHPNVLPDRDGMNVFNARAFTAPIPTLSDLSFELEYVYEENHKLMHSTAWNALGAYQLSNLPWKPKLSYRYAFFEGTDPAKRESEAFDPLYTGFYDWGTWWQGEIAGEYFLSNSNNISSQARVHMTPTEKLGWGVISYWFTNDQPATFGHGVTSSKVAFELDTYADWKFYKGFTLSVVGAYADPHKAVQEAYNRTSPFYYGMAYIAYSF